MEPCSTYKPWHNSRAARPTRSPNDGKCIHYYFYYFLDEELGLCYVRVPTWLPCRLQIYRNGHNWLTSQLRKRTIDYRLERSCLREDRRLDASPGNCQRTATQASASPLGAVRAPLLSPSSLLSGGLQCSLLRGEFNISGSQNKALRRCLQGYNSGRVSRLLKCLRTHGLVKKIGRT